MFVLSSILIAASLTDPLPMLSMSEFILDEPVLRLGDVADLSALSKTERSRLGPRVLARFMRGRGRIAVSPEMLRRWLRAQFPKASLRSGGKPILLVISKSKKSALSKVDIGTDFCWRLSTSLGAGEIISREHVTATDCADHRVNIAYFDRRYSVLRAAYDLQAGRYLGRIRPEPFKMHDKNRRLQLVTGGGPVKVARNVEALQPFGAGKKLFVKTANGDVVSVRYQETKAR